MKEQFFSVAIDGPAGAGKSTIASKVADRLGIEYIDTGAMYRAVTLKVLNENRDPKNVEDVIEILKTTKIDFENRHILLDGKNVDREIRQNIVNNNVSYVSQFKDVRDEMVRIQQNMSEEKSVIMDGRDIATVVLPRAEFKFFVTATVEERARRRYLELLEKSDGNASYEQILTEIKERDTIDSNRKIAPLSIADGAYILDTTDKTIDEAVGIIVSIIGGK